jgi:hypothetical protein
VDPCLGEHPQHRRLTDVHDVGPRAAVRELAVAAVGLAPLLGQLADRLALPAQQRVRGLLRARLYVAGLARGRPGLPAQHPHMPDAQRGR